MRQADTNQVGEHFFQRKKEGKDITDMLQNMYSHEFAESQPKVNRENNGISQEDLKFMQFLIMVHVRFPNNRSQAEKRFTFAKKNVQEPSIHE